MLRLARVDDGRRSLRRVFGPPMTHRRPFPALVFVRPLSASVFILRFVSLLSIPSFLLKVFFLSTFFFLQRVTQSTVTESSARLSRYFYGRFFCADFFCFGQNEFEWLSRIFSSNVSTFFRCFLFRNFNDSFQ